MLYLFRLYVNVIFIATAGLFVANSFVCMSVCSLPMIIHICVSLRLAVAATAATAALPLVTSIHNLPTSSGYLISIFP